MRKTVSGVTAGASLECDLEAWGEDGARNCGEQALRCGDTVEGHTGNGTSNWSNDEYREWFCHPIHKDWDGRERVFRLELEPMQVAELRLQSPCEDLDLFTVSWPHDDCPTTDHSISECNANVDRGGGEQTLVTQKNPRTFLVAVDGKWGTEGAFRLSVDCESRQ